MWQPQIEAFEQAHEMCRWVSSGCSLGETDIISYDPHCVGPLSRLKSIEDIRPTIETTRKQGGQFLQVSTREEAVPYYGQLRSVHNAKL